jgi:23S rRNA (cytidine1920-2'-O)/16S rRNA (cytidine1409-2'-O)-methyltransferase
MGKIRADVLMVQLGLAETRERAKTLIMAGRARVGTTVLVKPATMLDEAAPMELIAPERFVSRGGHKLEGALNTFAIEVAGMACMDLGASTGGFTDCLLQHGATSVLAVDVGRAQLHQKLRDDPRVTLLEGINARDLPDLPVEVRFFVADLSFISLRKVLPSVETKVDGGVPGVVLFKPQFEAGRADVPRTGVIKDGELRERLLNEFQDWLVSAGWEVRGVIESPIRGGEGNVEYLVYLTTPARKVSAC